MLTTLGELFVVFHATIRRCEWRNVDALNLHIVGWSGLCHCSIEVAHGCAFFQFGSAHVCLVDEEHKVGIKDIVNHTLILVGSSGRNNGLGISQSRGCKHALAYLYSRQCVSVFALSHGEVEIEVALHHFRSVDKCHRDRNGSTVAIADNRVIALHLFTLKYKWLWSLTKLIAIHEIRSNGYFGVFLKEFLGYISSDGARHYITHYFKRSRVGRKIFRCKRTHLLVTTGKHNCCACQNIQTDFFVHNMIWFEKYSL